MKSSILQYQSDWLKNPDCGRPNADFKEASDRTKRRKISELSKTDESIATTLRSCNSSQPI